MYGGGEACTIEKEMDGFHDAAPFGRVARTHGVCQDGVTFLNIRDGDVTIPRSGSDHGASKVGETTVGVTEVGDRHMSGGGIARGRRKCGRWGTGGMCGGEARRLLTGMADSGSSCRWKEAADIGRRQAGNGSQEAFVDGR